MRFNQLRRRGFFTLLGGAVAVWPSGASLDSQISGCTTVIQSGNETKWNMAVALYKRGGAYYYKGDNNRAISDYNEAIRLDPNHSRAFTNRGNAYYEKGDNNRAIADYSEAIRFDPDNAAAFNNLGWVRAIVGQLQAALDDCEGSLRLRPNDTEFLDSRGFAYLKLG
jgi:tetratricopeptide (TPR) repeat protein